jgi:hypothetical protein
MLVAMLVDKGNESTAHLSVEKISAERDRMTAAVLR